LARQGLEQRFGFRIQLGRISSYDGGNPKCLGRWPPAGHGPVGRLPDKFAFFDGQPDWQKLFA